MSANYCESCGRPFWTQTRAKHEADYVRQVLGRLIAQEGGVSAASRAFAARHGKKQAAVKRRFNRLFAGQKSLFDEGLRDELEVML